MATKINRRASKSSAPEKRNLKQASRSVESIKNSTRPTAKAKEKDHGKEQEAQRKEMLRASAKKLVKKEKPASAEAPKPEPTFDQPEVVKATFNCECGKEAFPGSHQCWECSHRA